MKGGGRTKDQVGREGGRGKMRGRVGSWETDRGKKGGRWGRKRRAEAFRGRARVHASSRKVGGFRGMGREKRKGRTLGESK